MNINSLDIHLVENLSYTGPVLLPRCNTLNFDVRLLLKVSFLVFLPFKFSYTVMGFSYI